MPGETGASDQLLRRAAAGGIKEEATGMRSVRALRRLKGILDGLGGDGLEL